MPVCGLITVTVCVCVCSGEQSDFFNCRDQSRGMEAEDRRQGQAQIKFSDTTSKTATSFPGNAKIQLTSWFKEGIRQCAVLNSDQSGTNSKWLWLSNSISDNTAAGSLSALTPPHCCPPSFLLSCTRHCPR